MILLEFYHKVTDKCCNQVQFHTNIWTIPTRKLFRFFIHYREGYHKLVKYASIELISYQYLKHLEGIYVNRGNLF